MAKAYALKAIELRREIASKSGKSDEAQALRYADAGRRDYMQTLGR
jgi:hypothetical protein